MTSKEPSSGRRFADNQDNNVRDGQEQLMVHALQALLNGHWGKVDI